MIQRLLLLIVTIPFSIFGFSQFTLKTPDGKTVKLHENGKWEYVTDSKMGNSKKIPPTSTANYLSKSKKYLIKYDPNQWTLDTTKESSGYTWDASFYSQDYAVTGYCLESRLTVSAEYTEEYIKSMFTDLGTIKTFTNSKDSINGLSITDFELELESKGITYTYKGYLTTTLKGSFLILVGTQKEVFEEDQKKIVDLLNGLTKNI